jgi:hypothetical protein
MDTLVAIRSRHALGIFHDVTLEQQTPRHSQALSGQHATLSSPTSPPHDRYATRQHATPVTSLRDTDSTYRTTLHSLSTRLDFTYHVVDYRHLTMGGSLSRQHTLDPGRAGGLACKRTYFGKFLSLCRTSPGTRWYSSPITASQGHRPCVYLYRV